MLDVVLVAAERVELHLSHHPAMRKDVDLVVEHFRCEEQ
jgi:hypothetical protein